VFLDFEKFEDSMRILIVLFKIRVFFLQKLMFGLFLYIWSKRFCQLFIKRRIGSGFKSLRRTFFKR